MHFKFLISALAFTFFAFVANASADPAPAVSSQLPQRDYPNSAYLPITAERLQSLSVEKRELYLERLRELMIEVEELYQRPNQSKRSASAAQDATELRLLLQLLIDEAQAAPSLDRWLSGATPRVSFATLTKRPTCGAFYKVFRINGRSLACVLDAPYRSTPCPGGTVAVHQHGDGRFNCMSKASFERLSPQDKWGMRAFNKTAAANPKLAVAMKNYRSVKTPFDNGLPVNQKANNKTRAIASQSTVQKRREGSTSKENRNPVSNDPVTDENHSTEIGDESKRTKQRFSKIALGDSTEPAVEAETDPQVALRQKKLDLCGVKRDKDLLQACPTDKILEGRRALYKTPSPMCMYAGNFSYYQDAQPSPGRCRQVSEFCFGKASCRKANGDLEEGVKVDASCAANEVICNPYIFSLKNNGQPYCVKPTGNATKSCVEATLKNGNPEVDSLKKSALYKFATSQQSQKSERLQTWFDGFNTFRDKIQEMCFGKPEMKDAFCLECNLIKERLIWMNAELLETDDKDKQCYGFLKLLPAKGDEQQGTAPPTPIGIAPGPVGGSQQ